MTMQPVLVEKHNGVATVILNRPDARNALNKALVAELARALEAMDQDPEVKVLVLRGAGDRAFCAGADLKEVLGHTSIFEYREHFGGMVTVFERMTRLSKPVIAAVHGYALAGGCGLAAACDLVIASEEAVFGLPEIKLGLLPLMVMAPIFRSVTRKKGLAMVLTGEQISARQAEGMGLVTLVVPKVQLDETVREMAERMAGLSPTALALAKEAFYTMTDMEYTKSLRYLRELITITSLTEDVKEGIAAFYEKRAPRWQGR